MLNHFVSTYFIIPESFQKNDEARLKVYEILIKYKKQNKILFGMTKS